MKRIISLLLIAMFIIGLSKAQSSDPKTKIEALEENLKKDPENVEFLLELGILYHHLAQEGNKDGIKRGEEIFKKLLEIDPENAQAYCWYGSLLTLKGKYATLPFNKIRFVNSGTKKMDKAVELAPDNITVRMIRANNSLSLPDFFHRLELAITDFEYLLLLKEKNPDLFSKDILVQIYFALGKAWQRKEDIARAKKYWQKVIGIDPDSKQGIEAKRLLK
ncbi:MAG: tetratricopeptide repeat protein [Candidatus Aminicenantia bacterium]